MALHQGLDIGLEGKFDIFQAGVTEYIGKTIEAMSGPIDQYSSTISPIDLGLYTRFGLIPVDRGDIFMWPYGTDIVPDNGDSPGITSFTEFPEYSRCGYLGIFGEPLQDEIFVVVYFTWFRFPGFGFWECVSGQIFPERLSIISRMPG
jgi:hypothetical protein